MLNVASGYASAVAGGMGNTVIAEYVQLALSAGRLDPRRLDPRRLDPRLIVCTRS